jgi:hypothetical protein
MFPRTLFGSATASGAGISNVWFPDLRKKESFIDVAILVKF